MESKTRPPDVGPLLLATKFHSPSWRADLVSRPRLLATLRRSASSKLTLISAPAGFGKTTLLSEWLADDAFGSAIAWISLDRNDNNPALFWTYVVTALQMHEPGLGEQALAHLHAFQGGRTESVLTSLINDLSASSQTFLLVLDDLHSIENQEIHSGIGFLLDHLPPQLRVVVTTRADPPLNLSRLRARGELNELRATDLRFSLSEASAFLTEIMGLHLSAEDVRVLDDRAEGWIAGLQLAALSVRDRADASGFIRTFAGNHRYIVDYLLEEVLLQQSEDTRSFLLQTSILDRLNGSLCDAVTGQGNGAARLIALERGNFFLTPLDNTRTWYRYHHLFADVLRARLSAEQPDQVPELHRRACNWYERQGATASAIDHALSAGDAGRAADLIEHAAADARKNRQEATLLNWISSVPADEIRRRPVLCVIYAGVLMQNGTFDDVQTWLDAAERWLDLIDDPLAGPPSGMQVVDHAEFRQLPGSLAVHRAGAALAAGDAPATIEHARRALAISPDADHLYHGAATALLGLASWTNGDLDIAYDSYGGGMASLRRAGNIVDTIGGALALADIRRAQGRLQDALQIYQQSLEIARAQGQPAPRGTADMYLGLSELSREWNDRDTAAHQMTQSEVLGESASFPQFAYRLRVAKARFRADLGDLGNAHALLDEAERRYASDLFPNVRPIPALRARLWIEQQRFDAVFSWARARRITPDDDISYLRAFELLTLARALLASAVVRRSSNIESAMRLLERLHTRAQVGEWTEFQLEALILLALGNRLLGNHAAAFDALERALSRAAPGAYMRFFMDEGEPMRSLLQTVAETTHDVTAQRILRAWSPLDRPAGGLVEPLTPREIEVLRSIAAGMRNQEIADTLFISLPTVKRHVANTYGKLGVAHRTEAVARATELGIL